MRTILIRLLIITALVYTGVQLWYGNVEKRLQERKPADTVVQFEQRQAGPDEAKSERSAADEIRVIVGRNIFQVRPDEHGAQETVPAASDIDQLEKTQLSLSLLGTVTGDAKDARAIIRDDKTRLEDLFRVGSTIQGALINRITRGKVVLLVNGHEEVLVLKDRDGSSGPGPAPIRRQSPVRLSGPPDDAVRSVPRAVPRRRISFRSPIRQPARPDPRELNEAPIDEEPVELIEDAAIEAPDEVGTVESGTDMEETDQADTMNQNP